MELIPSPEAAAILHISLPNLYKLIAKGVLQPDCVIALGSRRGYFYDRAAVEALHERGWAGRHIRHLSPQERGFRRSENTCVRRARRRWALREQVV